MNEKNWRIVFTRNEKRLTKNLVRKNIEVFCPYCIFRYRHLEQPLFEKRPLFPSMVFVRIHEKEIHEVLKVPGVINFAFWLGDLAIISHEDISNIHNYTQSFNDILLEKNKIGTRLQDKPDIIIHEHEAGIFKVLLPTIGYTMIIKKENFRSQESYSPPIKEVSRRLVLNFNNA